MLHRAVVGLAGWTGAAAESGPADSPYEGPPRVNGIPAISPSRRLDTDTGRLAVLVPRPRVNLILYYGILGALGRRWTQMVHRAGPDATPATLATTGHAQPMPIGAPCVEPGDSFVLFPSSEWVLICAVSVSRRLEELITPDMLTREPANAACP
jgi:hypothetical protein